MYSKIMQILIRKRNEVNFIKIKNYFFIILINKINRKIFKEKNILFKNLKLQFNYIFNNQKFIN